MKIALLSCFYPYRGGIAQFNANLFNELSKRHDVRAINFSRQYPDILFPGRTQYVTPEDEAVPVASERLLDTVSPFSWIRVVRELKRWKPDVLILRYWMSWFAPAFGFICRRLRGKCRVIAILDNVVPHEKHFFDAPLTRYMLSGVDSCVTLCDEVGKDLVNLRPDMPHITLPHPLYNHFGEKMPREEAECRLGLKPGGKNLLFFGLIRDYKGLDILLEAFGMLGSEYRLIIAGEPYGSFDKYQKAIDENQNRERIYCFPEYIRDSEVKLYFSAADVTVLPYRSATQSGISTISSHFEVPMIVTDVGGLRETIGERGTGIVCPDVSPQTIAEAIRHFFGDEALKRKIADCILKEKERLSWSGFSSSLIDFIIDKTR